jgi:hypothetical protein
MNYRHCQKFFPIPNILKSPLPPFKKGWNYKKLLLKSPFGKGGFRGIYNLQLEGIYGKRYMPPEGFSRRPPLPAASPLPKHFCAGRNGSPGLAI